MARYFYLITSLEPIEIGKKPDLSIESLDYILKSNLSSQDYEKAVQVRSYFDLENIHSFWSGFPLRDEGNFDEAMLEEALLTRSGLPFYVYDYMDKYEGKEERLKYFSQLMSAYFKEEIKRSTGFMNKLLKLERDIRFVLAALRAKTLGRDPTVEFQFEDPHDPLIADILAQKDAKNYEPPEQYHDLRSLYDIHREKPLELQKALLEYRYNKTSEMIGLKVFTLEHVLVYIFQWILAQQWIRLDQDKGKEIINSIVVGAA